MAQDIKGDYLGSSKKAKLAKKHGVEGIHFAAPDGRSGKPTRMPKDVDAGIVKAMGNDYHTQRALEAARMAGNKKAQKIGQISNIDEAMAAEKFLEKTHRKRMGNGGEYASQNDMGNVTDYWVKKDRSNMMDSMSAPEQQKAASGNDEPYEESSKLADARKTVDKFDNKDYDIYKSGAGEAQRKDAAQQFLGKYKLDLKQKANFKPTI